MERHESVSAAKDGKVGVDMRGARAGSKGRRETRKSARYRIAEGAGGAVEIENGKEE